MANPPTFQPGFDYSNWQATNPTKPLPGQQVDNDFANVARSINQAIGAVGDVRRSDGKLKNGIVTSESLSPTLSLGFTFRGSWQLGVEYAPGDGIVFDQVFYSARVKHAATNGNQPPDENTWTLLFSLEDIVVAGALSMPTASFTSDGVTTDFALPFTPVAARNLIVTIGGQLQATLEYTVNGNVLSFDVAPPIDANAQGYDIEVRAFATTGNLVVPEDGSVTTGKLSDASVTEPKIANGAVSFSKLDPAVQASIPALVADTMLVDNAAGTARQQKTFVEVFGLVDPLASLGLNNANAAANTAALTTILAVPGVAGTEIDMRMRTIPVTAVPAGNYRNGWWKVGGFLYRANRWKISNRRKSKLTKGSNYQSWTEQSWHQYRDAEYQAFTAGVGHDTEDNRPFMVRTYDAGLTVGTLVRNYFATQTLAAAATIVSIQHEMWTGGGTTEGDGEGGQWISWIGYLYATRAALYANLVPTDNAIAWVRGDSTPGYDGVYYKNGNSGTGSWVRLRDLPLIITTNSGARLWYRMGPKRNVRSGDFVVDAWEVLPHVGTPGYAYSVFQAGERNGQQFVSVRQRNLLDATLSYKLYKRRLQDGFTLDAPFTFTNGSAVGTVTFPSGTIHGMFNGERVQFENSGISATTYGIAISGDYAVSSVLTQSFNVTAASGAFTGTTGSGYGSSRVGDVTGVRIKIPEGDWSDLTFTGGDFGQRIQTASGGTAPPAIVISWAAGVGTWDVTFGASGYGNTGLYRINNIASSNPTFIYKAFSFAGSEPCVTSDGTYYYGFQRNNTFGQGPAWFWTADVTTLATLTEGRLPDSFGVQNNVPIIWDVDTGLLFATTMDRYFYPGTGAYNEPRSITKRNKIYVLTAKPAEFRALGSAAWRKEVLADDYVQMAQLGGGTVGSGSGVPSIGISGDLLLCHYSSEEAHTRGVFTDPDETDSCPNIIRLELNKWDFVWS